MLQPPNAISNVFDSRDSQNAEELDAHVDRDPTEGSVSTWGRHPILVEGPHSGPHSNDRALGARALALDRRQSAQRDGYSNWSR